VLGSWPVKIVLFLGVFAFFYHLCNGIRHLWWDTGRGFEIAQVNRSGWIVLAAAAALTLLAWGLLLSGGGA
jgi:succinate dehydrogenase / fumarate reductase cytochrome b subunit